MTLDRKPSGPAAAAPFHIRDWTSADLDAIVPINNAEVPHVTLLNKTELEILARKAFRLRVAEAGGGAVAGFCLSLSETAEYASLNFQWFKARYPRFIYVDRIVVAPSHRGNGLGRLLYANLEKDAKLVSPLLSCEVNLRPPNPESLRFHEKIGFSQAGTQETEGGKKTVALMTKEIQVASASNPPRLS